MELRVDVIGGTVTVDEPAETAWIDAGDHLYSYSNARAWDANGTELPVWLEPHDGGIVVVVDDTNAMYPIDVDPLIASATSVINGPADTNAIGFVMASAGDIDNGGQPEVVVGAPGYKNTESGEGRVFLYRGETRALAWSSTETNIADDAVGTSVAGGLDLNNDGIEDFLAGAPGYDGGKTDQGRALIFYGDTTLANSGGALYGGADLLIENPGAGANGELFGAAVEVGKYHTGSTIADVIVGAPGTNKGTVYVFSDTKFDGGETSKSASGGSNGDLFGVSLAMSDATNSLDGDANRDLVVGASGGDYVNVYMDSADFGAAVATKISGTAATEFGYAVTVSTGTVNTDTKADLAVGAPATAGGGAAYVYHGDAITTKAATLSNSGAARLGESLAFGDFDSNGFDDLLVGAPDTTNGNTTEGRAMVYPAANGGTGIATASKGAWEAEGSANGAFFGQGVLAINLDGGVIDALIGAPGAAGGGVTRGTISFYSGSADADAVR